MLKFVEQEIELINNWLASPNSLNKQILVAGTILGVVIIVKSASYLLKPRATENQGDISKRGFNEERIKGHYDTIVIGSGVGGSAYLTRNDHCIDIGTIWFESTCFGTA
jgi:hypothetical protein